MKKLIIIILGGGICAGIAVILAVMAIALFSGALADAAFYGILLCAACVLGLIGVGN